MTRQEMVEAANDIIGRDLKLSWLPQDDHACVLGPAMGICRKAVLLADAVLAREDDGPITPEWLAEIGAPFDQSEWHLDWFFQVIKCGDTWSIETQTSTLVVNATRRHVRLAMELFGVEAKGKGTG